MPGSSFLLYPQNAGYLAGTERRPRRLPSSSLGCATLIVSVLLIVGVLMLAFAASRLREQLLLTLQGVAQTGQVVAVEEDFDEGPIYWVEYRFTVRDQPYTRRQQVSEDVFNRAVPNASIDLIYWSQDPSISGIANAGGWGLDLFLMGFSLVWICVTAAVTYGIWWTGQRQRRLIREGRIITGSIRQISSSDEDGDFKVEFVVELDKPNAARKLIGMRQYVCDHLRTEPLPAIGTQVSILYRDDQNWEVL